MRPRRSRFDRAPREDGIERPPDPSPFLLEHMASLPRGRALDVACGSGRHAVLLAREGWRVEAVDRDGGRLRELARRAHVAGVRVAAFAADLEQVPLPRGRYDLVLNTRYLQRALAPALEDALRPGGMLVFETFTRDQRRFGRPRHPSFLLRPGELRGLFPRLEVLDLREGIRGGSEAVASLLARRT